MVATGSSDATARLWDVASGKQLAILHGHSDDIQTAAFSPDGSILVTASDDKTTRLWRIFPDKQSLIDRARAISHGELTPEQQQSYYLVVAPNATLERPMGERVLEFVRNATGL
jgi:WD40 repeat protein